MKLFTLVGASLAAQTSFDDAVSALSTRYEDLGLARLDNGNRILKIKTRALHRRMNRKFANMARKGCTVDSIDHDFSLDISKRCNAKSTLIADAQAASRFFDNHRKCSGFVRSFTTKYVNYYDRYFDSEVTCEVNLASAFGDHSTAVGRVEGDVIVFDGIKYGESSRFMRSTPANLPSSNDLSQPSFSCPTASNVLTGSATLPRTTEENEDCLYLKITAPLAAFEDGAAQRKVVTWIHGGTFNFGGMDVQYEDPTPLVGEQDIIVVKMNYRLGAFGGWYFPFRADGQPKSNFALLDQRLAMKWVQDNIGSFNGDSEDITLAGASAGAAAVAIHLTHEDSYDYFNNAIVMSATTTPYWTAEDATIGYGYIATQLRCTSEETIQADLVSGALVECLKAIPTQMFQAAMQEAGKVFGKIALDANRLSQMEFSFAPTYDGEVLNIDPRIALQSGQYKENLGFLTIESTFNEAQSISQNIFSNPDMRQLLFGEAASQLFIPGLNDNVIMPLAGYHGLMGQLFQAAAQPLLQVFPCAPDVTQGALAAVKTDCIDPLADVLSAYLFTCPIDFAMSGADKTENLYGVLFDASQPGPGPESGETFMQPYFSMLDKCFAATDNKSCHIEGARYFFGEYINQKLAVTDAEREFGAFYRKTYADLIKNRSSDVLTAGASGWTRLSVENQDEFIGKPMAQQCGTFNAMVPNGGIYGLF